MFTGIIEEIGTVVALKRSKSNFNISVKSSFHKEIKIDQSIAHNGVCLTVTDKKKDFYTVTAIEETLSKTNLKFLKLGAQINLERCMKADSRFDGHIVQGHVDCIAKVHSIKEKNGSWNFTFNIQSPIQSGTTFNIQHLIVEKGSICINGVSLTVVETENRKQKTETFFSTAIIPYTFHNTNFNILKIGDSVNIEFDIIGKYVTKILRNRS